MVAWSTLLLILITAKVGRGQINYGAINADHINIYFGQNAPMHRPSPEGIESPERQGPDLVTDDTASQPSSWISTFTGPRGAKGTIHQKGEMGPVGPKGEQGVRGPKGDPGAGVLDYAKIEALIDSKLKTLVPGTKDCSCKGFDEERMMDFIEAKMKKYGIERMAKRMNALEEKNDLDERISRLIDQKIVGDRSIKKEIEKMEGRLGNLELKTTLWVERIDPRIESLNKSQNVLEEKFKNFEKNVSRMADDAINGPGFDSKVQILIDEKLDKLRQETAGGQQNTNADIAAIKQLVQEEVDDKWEYGWTMPRRDKPAAPFYNRSVDMLALPIHTDCSKIKSKKFAKIETEDGGVFDIYTAVAGEKVEVYCDLTTDGGGWTVFQRRYDGRLNFNRNWTEYTEGFGEPHKEFWWGLEKLRRLTADRKYELRIELGDWEGNKASVIYKTFAVREGTSKYQLQLGSGSGVAGSSLQAYPFSTHDKDSSRKNCPSAHKSGWWFPTTGTWCGNSMLNGIFRIGGRTSKAFDGIIWKTWKREYYSLKTTEMKIRPTN